MIFILIKYIYIIIKNISIFKNKIDINFILNIFLLKKEITNFFLNFIIFNIFKNLFAYIYFFN